ncbi:MAG: MFS transporter [Chloroflexota bacterium]|nr:MFS transporter [Chloroflexota bacterium]
MTQVIADPTPPIIRRNTILIAFAQVFSGAGSGFLFSLGPLMVIALTGSAALAGASVALQGLSRFVAAYPFGRITDQLGRKPGLLVGLAITLVGSLAIGAAMNAGSFAGWVVGVMIFGIGSNGIQQLRLAAAEMYPPHRRAFMIGVVLTGSLAGIVLSPSIVAVGETLAPRLAMDRLAVPWLIGPVLILPSIALLGRLRPDPREIAADLARYYPSYVPNEAESADPVSFGLRRYLADPDRRVAALSMFAAQGSMQIAMVSAPLALTHHVAALASVALSMSIHTAGMFGPSIPVGRIADAIGRRAVLIGGTIVEAVGGAIAVTAGDQLGITAGIFLVGVGWCGANVASTAIVVDTTPVAVRGRAVGLTDTIAAVAGVAFPIVAGPMIELWGIRSSGALAVALLVPPAALLLLPAFRPARSSGALARRSEA